LIYYGHLPRFLSIMCIVVLFCFLIRRIVSLSSSIWGHIWVARTSCHFGLSCCCCMSCQVSFSVFSSTLHWFLTVLSLTKIVTSSQLSKVRKETGICCIIFARGSNSLPSSISSSICAIFQCNSRWLSYQPSQKLFGYLWLFPFALWVLSHALFYKSVLSLLFSKVNTPLLRS